MNREELIQLIGDASNRSLFPEAEDIAEDIAEVLLDAGWRPPNKAIESACFCTPGIIGTNYITINYCGTCGNEVSEQ